MDDKIDKLIAEFRAREKDHANRAGDCLDHSHSASEYAWCEAADELEANRDAIVAGAQRPLRFKKTDQDKWAWIGTHDKQIRFGSGTFIEYNSKQTCEDLGRVLGLPCEFID